jgi:hypothetical protein
MDDDLPVEAAPAPRPLWKVLLPAGIVSALVVDLLFVIAVVAIAVATGTDAFETLATIIIFGGLAGLIIAVPLGVASALGAVAGVEAMTLWQPRLAVAGAVLGSFLTTATLGWLMVGQFSAYVLWVVLLCGAILAALLGVLTSRHRRRLTQ